MILHSSVSLQRREGLLEPLQLEQALREHLGGEPLRWAITAVEGDSLHIEVSFRQAGGAE